MAVLDLADLKAAQAKQQQDAAADARELRRSVLAFCLSSEATSPEDALTALANAGISLDEFSRAKSNNDAAWNALGRARIDELVQSGANYLDEQLSWWIASIRWELVGRFIDPGENRRYFMELLQSADKVVIPDSDRPKLDQFVATVRETLALHDKLMTVRREIIEATKALTRASITLTKSYRDRSQDASNNSLVQRMTTQLAELEATLATLEQSAATAVQTALVARDTIPQLRPVVTPPAPEPVVAVPAAAEPELPVSDESETFTM